MGGGGGRDISTTSPPETKRRGDEETIRVEKGWFICLLERRVSVQKGARATSYFGNSSTVRIFVLDRLRKRNPQDFIVRYLHTPDSQIDQPIKRTGSIYRNQTNTDPYWSAHPTPPTEIPETPCLSLDASARRHPPQDTHYWIARRNRRRCRYWVGGS